MRKIFIVGIGAGNPDYITVQAINALNQVDVFFLTDKGREKQDLLRLRKLICERYVKNRSHRTVEIEDPQRDRSGACYEANVKAWHDERAIIYERMIREELAEMERGAFLVWGDPSLYDSTLRIIAGIAARGAVEFEYEVIPGISSIQALTARHRIPLNRIGASVHVTPGRRLSEELPADADDVVVLLDGECSFKKVKDSEVDIYWGAYLGTPDEILVSGNLQQRMDEIERVRTQARAKKGWIMDTYLLRKTSTAR
jgi:precorrin-6A synthase